jgi:hypothetical protein
MLRSDSESPMTYTHLPYLPVGLTFPALTLVCMQEQHQLLLDQLPLLKVHGCCGGRSRTLRSSWGSSLRRCLRRFFRRNIQRFWSATLFCEWNDDTTALQRRVLPTALWNYICWMCICKCFFFISITKKCQILSCDTLVANERREHVSHAIPPSPPPAFGTKMSRTRKSTSHGTNAREKLAKDNRY